MGFLVGKNFFFSIAAFRFSFSLILDSFIMVCLGKDPFKFNGFILFGDSLLSFYCFFYVWVENFLVLDMTFGFLSEMWTFCVL